MQRILSCIMLMALASQVLAIDPQGQLSPASAVPTLATGGFGKGCTCKKSAVAFVLDSSSSVSNNEMKLFADAVSEFMLQLNLGKTDPKDMSVATIIQAASVDTAESIYGAGKTYAESGNKLVGRKNTNIVTTGVSWTAVPSASSGLPNPTVLNDEAFLPGTVTDWLTGMEEGIRRLSLHKNGNKVLFVSMDGMNNVLPDGQTLENIDIFARLKSLITKATKDGISVWFLAVGMTEMDRDNANAQQKCQLVLDQMATADDKTIKKCIHDVKLTDDASRDRAKNVAAWRVRYHKQVRESLTYLEALSGTHQYKTAANFADVKLKIKEQAQKICEALPSVIHFDTSKPFATDAGDATFHAMKCSNKFFDCEHEVAQAMKELLCCNGTIYVGGHTSIAGSAAANQALSKRRVMKFVADLKLAGWQGDIMGGAFGEPVHAGGDTGDESSLAAASNRQAAAYCERPKSTTYGEWVSSQEFLMKPPNFAAPK